MRNGVKAFLGDDVKIEGISRAGFLDLYEVLVVTPEGPASSTPTTQARFFIFGSVIEAKSQTNFTEARLRKLNAIRFADLPLAQAVKIVRGKGTRPLAYFADPRCQYCKRFDQELTQVDDVTIYVFLLPIIAADSPAVASAVWCSPDRGKAWTDLMLKNVMPHRRRGLRHAAREEHRPQQEARHQGHAGAGARRRPAPDGLDGRGAAVQLLDEASARLLDEAAAR